MNFFEGALSSVAKDGQTAAFEGEGIKVKTVRLVSGEKGKGDVARLGVRPQHMRIDPKGQLKGKVTLVERLGTETIVELVNKDKTLFRFASPEAPEIEVGQDVSFSFDISKAHLF